LLAATLLPCVLMLALWGLFTVVFDSADWVWHHQRVAAESLLIVVLLLSATAWGMVGVARTAIRAEDRGESLVRIYGAAGLVVACGMGTAGQFGLETGAWLSALTPIKLGREPQAQIRVDQASGRLLIRGEFELGTTERVHDLLKANPAVRWVELDSPGGVAVEGLALGEVLAEQGVDTLVLRRCFSACISAFAGGNQRFLGPDGRLGLHSASLALRNSNKDVNEAHASFLKRRGVEQWLIDAERETPNSDLLVPGPATLLGSGLVTDMWPGDP